MEELYKEVAKEYGVSAEEVKREMQKAVGMATNKGNINTVEEMLEYIVKRVNEK